MNDIFLKVLRGEEAPYTPVWIMRQAGRYLREYRQVRESVDFLTLCKTPELAAKVTFQPVDILGVDAAILFSDILIPVEAMGMKLAFSEKHGPSLAEPIRTRALLERLSVPVPEDDLPFVLETVKILKSGLKVPLIGFSGAPFTLATYMIEGGGSKNFLSTKRIMYQNHGLFGGLMTKITDTVTAYLRAQIKAGADAVQLFDTWAGVLSPDDYRAYALPYVKQIIKELKDDGAPIIYFVNGCAGLLKEIKASGAGAIGIDWRIDMGDAVKKLGKKFVVQGNLDPCALLLPPEGLRPKVREILEKAGPARGHIFNLGHGILPEIPVENAKALVDIVHELSGKAAGRPE
ncbi:MAG: uroporphyrinogen decarboxylase [Nitrospiraceae bacterium]|nr:uroporphyrinogen decarboxylase [Nitrospiraceae bacterium]